MARRQYLTDAQIARIVENFEASDECIAMYADTPAGRQSLKMDALVWAAERTRNDPAFNPTV